MLAKYLILMYSVTCCGMIAMKREVAGCQQCQPGFPWSECQVRKLTTSHCTKIKSASDAETTCEVKRFELLRENLGHTRESVQSPLVVLKARQAVLLRI